MNKSICLCIGMLICLALIFPFTSCKNDGSKDLTKVTISSVNQEYTISLKDKAQVIIPPNALPKGASVSIKEISDPKTHDPGAFQPVAFFDISSSEKVFAKDLTIEFTYDKTNLDSTLEPSLQLAVAYYNDAFDNWREVDFKIDEINSRVVVKTDHLSVWALFVKDDKYIVSTAPHFTIYSNKHAKAPLIGGIASGDLIYEYTVIVRTALFDAYKAYDSMGLKLPDNTRVYIDDWGAKKDVAEWGWFSKNIDIPVTYYTENELRHVVAHEVFHTVQNQYVTFATMHANRWWMEATADYAAAYVANQYGLKEKLGSKYLSKSIADSETFHSYQTAHFVKFLVDSGLSFKDSFNFSMSQPNDILTNLAEYSFSQGRLLPALYDEFAYQVIFGTQVITEYAGTNLYEDLTTQKMDLELDKAKAKNFQVNVGANYAASLSGLKITNSNKDEVALPVKVEPTTGVKVQYIIVKGPGKGPLSSRGSLSKEPVELKVEDGDYLYFLTTNVAVSSGIANIIIGEESGEQPYSNKRTASIYNNTFIAEVEFNLLANQVFVISEERTNAEMLKLTLDFPAGKKDIVIDVEALLTGLRFTDPGKWGGGRQPVITEMYWATSQGLLNGTQAKIVLNQDDPRGITSFGYELVIEVANPEDGKNYPGGGGTVILITARIMN